MISRSTQTRSSELYGTILEVRRLFHELARSADALHADTGITSSQRAVLEALAMDGPASVSSIAREKRVTRQHIQVLAKHLLESGLIEAIENPAHQRSPLLRLTKSGRGSFDRIQAREQEFLRAMAEKLGKRDYPAVTRTLRDMGRYLNERTES